MKRKTFENIGKVSINEISLCDTEIGLYMPIEKMSENIKAKYEWCKEAFNSIMAKKFPQMDLSKYTLLHDISLHMNINNSEITYSISIIIWMDDENGKEIHAEFFDPFEIEINAEDNKYLKKLVMNKLMESFF